MVAQALLGKKLVRVLDGVRVAGYIVETEAYCDCAEGVAEPDLACHGSKNGGKPTARTEIMFGRSGHAYIYFNYGIHWLFNVVTGEVGEANAVLIRALEPCEGEPVIAQLRSKQPRAQWTNGPAKLTKALAIDKTQNGIDLCHPDSLILIEDGFEPAKISSGPRVGLGKTPEPWFSMPWRYWVEGNDFVSAYR